MRLRLTLALLICTSAKPLFAAIVANYIATLAPDGNLVSWFEVPLPADHLYFRL
jgi:hypothetical protein